MVIVWKHYPIEDIVQAVSHNAQFLNELDAAIGDGDLGTNLSRGLLAVSAMAEQLESLEIGEALQKAGATLVGTVGGASGPLYGSLLIGMGKAAPPGKCLSIVAFTRMLRQGIVAAKRRGKAEVGEKTMLDVLVPVSEALDRGITERLPDSSLAKRVQEVAAAGVEATRTMPARKGRAAQLGVRSLGHRDPGAMACFLVVKALCDRVLSFTP